MPLRSRRSLRSRPKQPHPLFVGDGRYPAARSTSRAASTCCEIPKIKAVDDLPTAASKFYPLSCEECDDMIMIPYTHWAYFPDEAAARRCAEELVDYVIRVRGAENGEWLLLAGRDVLLGKLEGRHAEVEQIVTRHGGNYDGGECTYESGQPVADPMLVDSPCQPH